jgi:preprotein translocase subunit YajC
MSSFLLSIGPGFLLMGAPQGEGGASSFMSFLPLVAIIAIFYFLILRPQNKKQKETQKMLSALKKGDRVVTIGGIHGVIQSVKESTIIVKVDENVKLEFNRSAVSGVERQAKDDSDEKKIDAPEEKKNGTSEAEEK